MTEETTQPETNLPEQNVEDGKKKSNKAIIVINIIAVLLIGGMAAYYFFVFKKNPEMGSGRGFAAQEFSADDFCELWEERQDRQDDFQPPDGREMPEGMEDRMAEQNEMMERICEDGEVSEEEQEELEEIRGGFGRFKE